MGYCLDGHCPVITRQSRDATHANYLRTITLGALFILALSLHRTALLFLLIHSRVKVQGMSAQCKVNCVSRQEERGNRWHDWRDSQLATREEDSRRIFETLKSLLRKVEKAKTEQTRWSGRSIEAGKIHTQIILFTKAVVVKTICASKMAGDHFHCYRCRRFFDAARCTNL